MRNSLKHVITENLQICQGTTYTYQSKWKVQKGATCCNKN